MQNTIPVFFIILLALGCQRNHQPASTETSGQPWQKHTRIESAWDQPGNPVVLRISNPWQFRKVNKKLEGINIQGEAAFTLHGNEVETVRGIYFYIHPSEEFGDGGDGYLDFDEIQKFVECIDKFTQDKNLLSKRDSSIVGMSYRTKGGMFFRTGSLGSGYVIGARKSGSQNEDVSVSGLNEADLSEFKIKLELARQWAEKQVP